MGDLLWGMVSKKRDESPEEEKHKHWFYQAAKGDGLITCDCFPKDFKQEIIDAIKRGREKRDARRN